MKPQDLELTKDELYTAVSDERKMDTFVTPIKVPEFATPEANKVDVEVDADNADVKVGVSVSF